MMKTNRRTLFLTLGATFVLIALLVTYTSSLVYISSYTYINELGNDKTSAIASDLENYLENASSVLWITADTVDHMVANGATKEEIVEYITRESTNAADQFDDSYTGYYGVINGEYVDGVGWVPPENYDATERDWYKDAIAADGQTLVVSPYVDSQTGDVILSVCKALSDKQSVLGMDLMLSDVQEKVEDITINGNGYAFIVDYEGTVIAHRDSGEKGKNYYEDPDKDEIYDKIMNVDKDNFEMEIDGKKCTVFVDDILSQWQIAIVVENSALYRDTRNVLIVSVLIGVVVFSLIAGFYIIAYNYERKVNRRMEEVNALEQKREYEAKILMLEKAAADSANKAKSDFLADMSHEIRTPINAVLGMNEMILRESKDDQILEYSSNIKSAGNTLLSIINNILDFSKIEDGKMSLVPVEFDFAELISGLVNSISERARSKKLGFLVDIDESVPSKLYGDDVRISQVIMNLLTNAVKYTETGSVTLMVRNIGINEDNVKLSFDVIDTGIGIKEEDLGKLFESFERIEEKRNRHIEGTGLGISIVTKLLAMMDSKLDVESKYGVGSVFGFELSLRVIDETPIGKYEEKRKAGQYNRDDSDRLYAPDAKVLVTDDNAMNLKVAVNFLRIFGIEPATSSSGLETIELMRKNKYDILFLDHMMPVLDGFETLKALNDENLLNDTKVIALTANAVVGAEEMYLNAGFDGYLSKPVTIDNFEKALKNYLPDYLISDSKRVVEKQEDPHSLDKMRALGLNVDAALGYAGGEEDFYLELLTDYANSAEEKCESLDSFLANNDLNNYEILIHSLKSTSRMVGADDLSDQARDLQDAAGKEEIEYVKDHHTVFVRDFKALAEKILN